MKHIAIAGLGVVGGGVAEILLKNAALLEKNAGEKIVLKAIYTRTPKKDGPFAPYFVSDFSAIEQDPEIDLVVETIGGSTVALDFVSRALKAGKHVVTANKQLIAEHGLELFALAKANGVNILFEASVAGGIPVLNPLTHCLGANEITEVSGILNGTTNYILTQCWKTVRATPMRFPMPSVWATPRQTPPQMSRASTRQEKAASSQVLPSARTSAPRISTSRVSRRSTRWMRRSRSPAA